MDRDSHAIEPNSAICRISFAVLSSNHLCLINNAILRSEHVKFLALPSKYSFILKRKIGQKLLSYNSSSAGYFTTYRMTEGSMP